MYRTRVSPVGIALLGASAALVASLGACATSGGGAGGDARLRAADSALVGRMLLAEDGRDSTDQALDAGQAHANPTIRMLATRALGRIRDPRFATRDSLPPLPPPPVWPEPEWKERYRALTAARSDCSALRAAMTDPAPPVRLRAIDLLPTACAGDDAIAAMLYDWIDALPPTAIGRARGALSWHLAAHSLVALARLRPDDARQRIWTLSTHPQWQVRMYAANAAAAVGDAARLRFFARDSNDNVKEAAITALAKLTGHADDSIYIAALASDGAQAVRAAAIALKGSSHPDVTRAANAAFDRFVGGANASERDARIALLEAARRPGSDDQPPPIRIALPPRAVALALGADVRLRVTIAASSGGGSFVVRLRGDVAPMMAARILALVNQRYYDGLTWHRVEHDFVIQGGSPGANEYVGHADLLRDELGTVPHLRGTIGMSTRGHDTGDAQWFINLRDNLRLGRDYTVFAEVVEGMDVVDGIVEGDVIERIEEIGRR